MHPKLIIMAIKLKGKLKRLKKAKENAKRERDGLPPKISTCDRVISAIKDKCCQNLCPCCVYDPNRKKKRVACWDNPILLEVSGFLAGVVLTLMMYLVLIFQMEQDAKMSGIGCCIGGAVITLLAAFSKTARCVITLIVPCFFSSKGRMLLLVYATFLAMNYPMQNVRMNMNVMSQSITCGQELTMNGTKDMVKAAAAPMQGIMDAVKDVLQQLTNFSNKLKATYTLLKKTVTEIGATVKRIAHWLAGITDVCNDKMGAPYRKCLKIFDDAYNDCRDKLGFLSGICEITNVIGNVCVIARVGELLCMVVDAIQSLLMNNIELPAQRMLMGAREMFYFNVSLSFHYNYTINQSKSYEEVKNAIKEDIHEYIDGVLDKVQKLNKIMPFFIILVLIQALMYKSKYMTKDRHDNYYITFTLKDLEKKRTKNGKGGIFPLVHAESKKYVGSYSAFMVGREKRKLIFGIITFITAAINIGYYLFCDYGMYSALGLIEKNFGVFSEMPLPAHTKMHVDGQGPLSDMYRTIVGMFDPLSTGDAKVSVASCVPHPIQPNWGIYWLIGALLVSCFVLTVFQPYGMRMRHVIMGCYYPQRERRRALYLYNHILKLRGGVLSEAKKDIKGKSKGDTVPTRISLKGRLAANFAICEKFLKCLGWEVKSCLYCGREGKPDDYLNFVHCMFYDCDAVYCLDCYADLDNKCAVCNKAVEIGDDETSEEDSSVDEQEQWKQKTEKKFRNKKIQQIKDDRIKMMQDFKTDCGVPPGANNSAYDRWTVPTHANNNAYGRWTVPTHDNNNAYDRSMMPSNQYNSAASNCRCMICANANNNSGEHFIVDMEPDSEEDDVMYNPYNNVRECRECRCSCPVERGYLNSPPRPYMNTNTNAYPIYDFQTARYQQPREYQGPGRVCYPNSYVNAEPVYDVYPASSSDEDSEISSGSSIDTDDLDFSYQGKAFDEVPSSDEDYNENSQFQPWSYYPHNKNKILDLATEDMFSDSDDSDYDSDASGPLLYEPRSVFMSRQ